ncbi:hypothetical protein AVEN_273548-1 [Araneus ventricosus]|uniref:Uncharacterized protein n=1 Tax=Araneus ventricosus TaxID=182803 RepID=A0A4Y2L8D1_ARAVE|nr:hypothetical protein AVEN_273548-1 [Araneus ventricosus]
MSGRVKTPSFNLASDSFGNLEHRYMKHSPSLGIHLINCFISSNFICRGGNKSFAGGTEVVFMTLFSPGVKTPRSDQSVLAQWRSLAQMSHKHKRQRYFVKPACRPNNVVSILKSP